MNLRERLLHLFSPSPERTQNKVNNSALQVLKNSQRIINDVPHMTPSHTADFSHETDYAREIRGILNKHTSVIPNSNAVRIDENTGIEAKFSTPKDHPTQDSINISVHDLMIDGVACPYGYVVIMGDVGKNGNLKFTLLQVAGKEYYQFQIDSPRSETENTQQATYVGELSEAKSSIDFTPTNLNFATLIRILGNNGYTKAEIQKVRTFLLEPLQTLISKPSTAKRE